jgi:hypothetical protein
LRATPTFRQRLGFPADLRNPPADANEQKAPVVEKFGRLAFESMADELKNPSGYEKDGAIQPEVVPKKTGHKNRERNQNGGNAQRMANTIDRVLMAGRVLLDPLFAGAIA